MHNAIIVSKKTSKHLNFNRETIIISILSCHQKVNNEKKKRKEGKISKTQTSDGSRRPNNYARKAKKHGVTQDGPRSEISNSKRSFSSSFDPFLILADNIYLRRDEIMVFGTRLNLVAPAQITGYSVHRDRSRLSPSFVICKCASHHTPPRPIPLSSRSACLSPFPNYRSRDPCFREFPFLPPIYHSFRLSLRRPMPIGREFKGN